MMTQEPFFTSLKQRGLIKISGIERYRFLQELITNDIELLHQQESIYSCLLNPQGKFMFDFFITQNDDRDTIYLECEGNERATALTELLTMYNLRSQVEISVEPLIDMYTVIGLAFGYQDPRHITMGYRSFNRPMGIIEKTFEDWKYLRIQLTIPDGSNDMLVGQSTMVEARIQQLNGLSHDKGCYVGQEVTTRMHRQGTGKKYLKTIKLDDIPENADLRSTCRDIGIALVHNHH